MPPRRSIRDEDWERLRSTIRKLYLEEDRSLKDVLLILGTFHSFYPSKAQLEWKLKQWHFTKNMGIMDWKYVANEIHRRKCRGKESKVYLSGIPLRMKAIERGVSRYCYQTAIEKATRRRVLGQAISYSGSEDNEIVRWLLSVGVDLNERLDRLEPLAPMITAFWSPLTPLQEAIQKGWSGLMQELIECGADINELSSSCGTALQLAAELGHFGIVQRLLELGADPNASGGESPYSRTAIERAAQHGRLDVVQLLLNSGVEIGGCGRRQYVRSVALAEKEGHHAIVKLLKSHGGWTEADEALLSTKDVCLPFIFRRHEVVQYVRRYYVSESDVGDSAEGDTPKEEESSSEGALKSNVELNEGKLPEEEGPPEEALVSDEILGLTKEDMKELDKPSEGALEDNHDSTIDLIGQLYNPSEALMSTLGFGNTPPNAYESLLEEEQLEFLPSSMSYQIREELEGTGCQEELGDDLWAEEYSNFIQSVSYEV
ncbi:hypothetical protein GCG54_00012637 [Colletotrichum gloeosporioides]|uniref:Clr5 domain-containing protein n=1 Tax=Colletotrichum gloeosporioides TaxID=474922 RepID=A0A8H4CQ76_COLGL|nr:uncharacterized protein GCG54_00012637 [Colletotrichum gloeosporioides]KAF3808058.1 hypothetical protein GCG54_00012637 [Colletotrichum gloeosporioides]